MITTEMATAAELTDAELVTPSLAGDRDAYARIVGHAGPLLLCAAWIGISLGGLGCNSSAKPTVETVSLTNGVRVVSVRFPGSTNISIFTFLPMGLTSDSPGQAQWSHLVEHLVIRSTVPGTSPQANAETLPDHMRLDYYGNNANWTEGLSHHRRWIEGVPFTEANLRAEKPKVNQECDFTAHNFATHKFAVAAWSQGARHGKTNITLKGDVTRASLTDVQQLRDARLAVSNQVTVCIVSGLEPKQVLAEATTQLGDLHLQTASAPTAKPVPGNLDLTWDLEARHLLVTWPIPDFRDPSYPALLVAAQCWHLFSDADLKSQTGMLLAGADLATPEGSFFYVSASLKPGSNFEEVRQAILARVAKLTSDSRELSQVPLMGAMLGKSLTELPSAESIKSQAPAGISLAMIEGNLGLQLGMAEHRYGEQRSALAKRLAEVTRAQVQEVARKYLAADKAAICAIKPAAASRN